MEYKYKRNKISVDTNNTYPHVNFTYKYMTHVFSKSHGDEFYKDFWNVKWYAFGVDDHLNSHGLNMYCLGEVSSTDFTQHEHYVSEYMYDFTQPKLNMYVFKFEPVVKFVQGEYSKMFDSKQLSVVNETFTDGNNIEYNNPAYSIYTKDEDYKQNFINKIYEEFDIVVKETDVDELEFTPIMENEIFNYNINYEYEYVRT